MPDLFAMTDTLLQAPKPDKQSAIGNAMLTAARARRFRVPWTVTARWLV